jgi:hypothetical protein
MKCLLQLFFIHFLIFANSKKISRDVKKTAFYKKKEESNYHAREKGCPEPTDEE